VRRTYSSNTSGDLFQLSDNRSRGIRFRYLRTSEMPSRVPLVSASAHRSRSLGVQFHRCRTDDTNSSAFRLAIPGTHYHLPTNPLRSRSDRKKKCNSPPFIRTSYRYNRARRLDEHRRFDEWFLWL
jgi:hypothetical protein